MTGFKMNAVGYLALVGYTLIEQLAIQDKSYKIILTARNVENGKKALAELHNKGLNNVSFIQLDVTDDNSIDRAYDEVEKQFGKLDYTVLNAGVSHNGSTTREVYAKVYDINVVSNTKFLQKFKPLIYGSSKPRVLFISSGTGSIELFGNKVYGALPVDYVVAYSATKAALNLTMAGFKNEWTEVKFCCIDPGHCATSLSFFNAPKTPLEGVKAALTAIRHDNEWENGQFLQFEPDQKSLTIVPW